MKKGVKIALGIVGVLVVGGAALAAWQWNNLNALRYGLMGFFATFLWPWAFTKLGF